MSEVKIDVIHFVTHDTPLGRIEMLRALFADQHHHRQQVVHLGRGRIDTRGLGQVRRVTALADVGWLARGTLGELLARPGQTILHAWSAKALDWILPKVIGRHRGPAGGARLLLDVEFPLDLRRLAAAYSGHWSNGSIRFLCPTDTALRRTLESGARVADCILIRDSVDFGEVHSASADDVRNQTGVTVGTPVVLLLPPVLRETGALTGAWAAMLLAQIRADVCIVLPDSGREVARIRRLVESCGEVQRLRCPGRRLGVRELLAVSDAAVYLPEGDAPLGAVASAMAAGCPIVASAVPATTELLVHGRNAWLCKPDDPKDAARRLLQALEDPERSRRQAASARSQAFEMFGRRRMVEQYRRAYQNALSGADMSEGVAC